MFKIYRITPKGKSFLNNKSFLEVTGYTRNELRGALQMYKDDGKDGKFLFSTDMEWGDHSFKQHIELLEKMKCIERDEESEQNLEEFLDSLPTFSGE